MYFSNNRRGGAIVTTAAGAALQQPGGMFADSVYLTPEQFAAARVASDGQVLLQSVRRDECNAVINIIRQEKLRANNKPLVASMRSSGANALVSEFVRSQCDVGLFAQRLVALANDANARDALGLPARCTASWLAKQISGVSVDNWSVDDNDVIAPLRTAERQYADANWLRGRPQPRVAVARQQQRRQRSHASDGADDKWQQEQD
jgi:hypothetical protein